jgi:hypothetical protein
MAAGSWSSLPYPVRGSPFYTLKSIAFSKEPAAAASKASVANASPRAVGSASVVLPPVGQTAGELEGNRLDDKAAASRQLKRRDAALEEFRKVEEQLKEVLQKLIGEKQARAASHHRKQEISASLAKCNKSHKEEVERIKLQQRHLHKIRLQMKEIKETNSYPSSWVSQEIKETTALTEPVLSKPALVEEEQAIPTSPPERSVDTAEDVVTEAEQAHQSSSASCFSASQASPQGDADELALMKAFPHQPSVGSWFRPRPMLLWAKQAPT